MIVTPKYMIEKCEKEADVLRHKIKHNTDSYIVSHYKKELVSVLKDLRHYSTMNENEKIVVGSIGEEERKVLGMI